MDKAKSNRKSMLLLTGLLMISCLGIFKDYLFGGKYPVFQDIGADTASQYMMQYQTMICHIKEGSFSLWDFNNGYGANMYSLSLYDPFVLVICLYGVLAGAQKIYGLMVWMQIVKIILAGLSCYGFLSCFSLSERSKILSAYAYGLCGYMIVWGQHYQFGTVVILFPLLLMAAEKSFRKTIWLLYLTVLCALSCACTLYFSYMQFLVLGFYVLFRTSWEDRLFRRHSLICVGKIYGSMVLGIGLALFSLLPSACLIFGVSGRVGSESLSAKFIQALRPYDAVYYKSLTKHFLSGNLLGINDYSGYLNYYEDPNVYLSVLWIFTGVQFLYFTYGEKGRKKQKILLTICLLLCGFVLLVPAGSLIFNGFSYPFSRHTFLCMPFFVWMMAKALDRILEEKKLSPILLGAVLVVVVLEYGRIYVGSHRKLALCLGLLAVFVAAGLFGCARLKKKKAVLLSNIVLVLALVGSMTLDAWDSYGPQRVTLAKDSDGYFNEMYSKSVKEALAYLEETDASFYRVEKDYTIDVPYATLNAMAQNYMGVSTYNSMLNTNLAEFLDEFWPTLQGVDKNHYSYVSGAGETVPASLSHVKYVLSKSDSFPVSGYELLRQFGDIYVYRNINTEDAGKFFTAAFRTEDYEKAADFIDREALLSDHILCDTVPSVTEDGEKMRAYQKTESSGKTENLSSLSEGIRFDACKKDSVVTGAARVTETGVLLLPIPYENGWHAYVDGEEHEIHQVNYGFSGIELEPGEHEVRMVFKCPGFAAGVAGSVISLLITAGIWSFVRLRKKGPSYRGKQSLKKRG